jgi:hypothetical protein
VSKLNWAAVWKSALSISLFLVPLGILQTVLIHGKTISKGSGVNLVIFGVFLFLTAVAGFGAARQVDHDLAQHGAAAGAAAYVIVQGIGFIHHLILGDHQDVFGYVYLALLSATCGMLGAMLERRQRRMTAIRNDINRNAH